ncbi:PKD domain-containing protein [Phaeodactylibacter xiamenensis]|uniref:PKD domain-containing protein n=1 Tax=Phaeodactylibacter xiamenensis TaxID=1524460 RepID=UPI0024A91FE9|nr:PKD domain-containing protein [Phaeodactylibacter xiamenensis]
MTYSRYSYPYKKYVQSISCFFSFICLASVSLYGQNCDAGFSFSTDCNVVTFTPNDTTAGLSYTWDFGDGMTSMEEAPEHIYFEESSGSYSYDVTLIVAGGCVPDTITQTVITNVGALPDPSISSLFTDRPFVNCEATNDEPLFMLEIENTSSTIATNDSYHIDWGDGAMPYTGNNIPYGTSHEYQSVGLFDIVVTVTGNNGCVAQDTFPFFNGSNPGVSIGNAGNTVACIPETVEFPILLTENNAPETTYAVWVNDGSGDTTYYSHPPPSDFIYTFTQSACDSAFQTMDLNGSFSINIIAENPCLTQPGATSAIVNSPPQADFDIEPSDIQCVQDTFSFINMGIPANYFSSDAGGCIDSMRSRWTIHPNVGYDIIGGNSELFSNDGFSAVFTESGQYDITLVYRSWFSSGCSPDTITKPICVVPIPEAAFSSSSEFGCLPQVIDFTNESNTLGSCDTTLYTWEVNFLGGECDTLGGWSFVDTFNMNSINSSIRFDAPGQYEVLLIVDNRCAIDTTRDTITIANNPVITLDSIPDSCDDALVSPSIDAYIACNDTDPPTYEWYFPGGTPSSHTGEFPPDIEYTNNSGMPIVYTISLVTTNVCGPDTATQSFTIFPSPDIPDISSNSPVCTGQTLEFMLDNADGLDFAWEGPEGWTSDEEDPSIPDATPLYTGAYFLTVTDQISGCTNDTVINAVVYELPSVVIIPNPAEVCIGQSVTLTATGAVDYQWTPNQNLNTDMGASVVVTPTDFTTLEYIVMGTDANGCVNRDTTEVIVHPLPVVSIVDPGNLCVNVPTQLEGQPDGTSGGSGFWTGDFVSNSGIFNTSVAGTYTVTYHYRDDNMCEDSSSINICVLDMPQSSFNINAQQGCIPFDVETTNTSNTLDDCEEATYTWSISFLNGECNDGPGVFEVISGDTNSINPTFRFLESGIYEINLTVMNQCGSSTSSQMITVGEFPEVAVDSIIDYCDVASIMPTFQSFDCELPIQSYLWEFPTSSTMPNTSTNPMPGTFTFGVGTHVVELSVTNVCGTTTDVDTFVVLQGPGLDINLSKDFVCLGDTLSVINNSVGDNLSYSWSTVPDDVLISDPTDSIPIFDFTPAGIGNYQIFVSIGNEVCDTIEQIFDLRVSTSPMMTLDTIPDACEAINIDPVFDYGIPNEFIDSVLWKVTNSAGELVYTSMDLDPGTINIMGDDDYTIMVTAYNRCDSSVAMDNFSVLEGPSPLFFIDTNFVCEGGVIMVTDSSGGDGLLYDWTVSGPSGAVFDIQTPTSSDPVITFTEGIGDYTISVELSNPVCDAVPWDTLVMVSRPPMVSLDTVPDDCEVIAIGPVFDYGIPDVFIDSVRWKVTNSLGEMIYTSTDLYPDTIDIVGDDDYTLMVTAYNRCDSSVAMDNFSILEGPSPLFFIDTNFVCEGGMIMVTDSSGGDALLYDWIVSGPPGADIDIQAPTSAEPVVTFIEGIGDYTISVEVSNPVCDGVPWDTVITVNRPPTVSLAEIDSYCDEAVFTPVATYSDTSFIDSVRWILPFITSPVSTSTEFNPGPFTISQTGIYDVSVIVYNRCGSDTATQSFQIYEGPVLDIALDTNSVCRGDSLGVQNSSTGDSLSYIWDAPPGIEIIGDDSPNPIFVLNVPNGDYSITVTISNPACDDLMEVFMVQVIEPPTVMFEDIPDTCELADITPIPIYYEIGFIDSVDWLFPGGNPALSNQFYPESILYQGAGVYTITAEVFNACGMDSFSQSFTIDTIPEIILGSTDTLCVYDSIFQIPPAIPAGGYWTGPGIIDQDLGTFDPSGFPGGQVVTVTYNFEDGECFVSEEKDIYVSDPSYVAVDTTLGFCASDTCSLIQVGEPVSLTNGWYEGPGITDSIGVFCPQLLGGLQDTTVTITYFYREPGTDCIGSDDFTVTVYALPIPGISGIDSLCVDVPETILNTTVDGNTYEWYFSDGGFYTGINPVHTFDSTGLDTIVLIAISIEGCVDSTSAEVFISGPPVAEFEMDTTMGCAILPVTFTNTSIGYQHVNYSWEFGGGDPLMSTLEQPGTVLFDQGTTDTTYFITMVAENHCGIDSYEDSVIVFPSPLTNFMASQYSGCTPLYVAFNNTTLGEPDSFFWDLGNGLTSTDSIPPDQLYTAVGPDNEIYTVTLVAFNECGLDSMSRDILVKPDSLRAFFSVDLNEGCEPLTVEFSNTTSPDSAIVYNWFFDQNDDTSNAQDTSYTFWAQGDTITTYTVSLVVDNGCARDTFSVDIDVFPRPIVSFEAPSAVCAQDSAYFQNTSIDVNGVFWDFGDGNTSSATNPNHFYDAPGTYMVRLTAFSINTGCPNVDSMEVQVRPLPQPSLSVSPLFGCPPLTVDIENTTMDGVFFTWDFGDGNTDVGGNITDHTYTSTGMYDITLIAVDSFGCGNDTIFSSVEVYPVPEAAFDVHQVDQCGVPQEVCLLNFSVGAQGYEWAAGSFSSEENHPCFIFDEAGTYEVGLIAENVFLCSDTINGEFTVYEKPEAFFEIVSDTTCEGAPVFFDNLSSNAEFVTWYYGDGTVDTSWNGQHEYLDTGIYIVNLVAGNNSGCQDTFTMEPGLTVFPTPLAAFDFEKLDNELPTTFSFTDQSSDDVIWHSWDMDDGSFYNSPNVIHRYLSRFSKQVALTVENMYNCIDTTSAQIDLDVLTGLFVPNILEPSNQVDPEKAVFKPKGIGLEIYHIAIYARNGQLVWESTELDEEGVPQGEWDGKLAGVDLPGGVYVWKVHEARFIDGTRWDGMEDQKGKLRTSNFLILVR